LSVRTSIVIALSRSHRALRWPCHPGRHLRSSLVDRSFADVLDAFGAADEIFNNAGTVGAQTPLHETTDDTWRRVMAVNADEAF
jgi:NAD(P)-dependent dehydrogenase (short-subunit alcohol dehydrogenase family)